MDKRTLFYWGRLFNKSLKKGEDYKELNKVITINILNFNYLQLKKFHSTFHLYEDGLDRLMLTDILEVHFIEMPKFLSLKECDYQDKLQRWLTFLNENIDSNTLMELIQMDRDIEKAVKQLERLMADEEVVALYEYREEARLEYNSKISYAEERGLKKGLEEGVKSEAKRIAVELLKKGMDIDFVVDMTKLSKEVIEQLLKEVNE